MSTYSTKKYYNITRYDLRVPTYEYSIYKTRHYFTWSNTRNSFISFVNQEINELELLDSIDGELLRASRLFVDSSVRTDNSLSHPSHVRLVYRYSTIVLVVRSQQKREMERSSAAGSRRTYLFLRCSKWPHRTRIVSSRSRSNSSWWWCRCCGMRWRATRCGGECRCSATTAARCSSRRPAT